MEKESLTSLTNNQLLEGARAAKTRDEYANIENELNRRYFVAKKAHLGHPNVKGASEPIGSVITKIVFERQEAVLDLCCKEYMRRRSELADTGETQ